LRHIVAHTKFVEQEAWLRRVRLEFATQVANEGAQVGIFSDIFGSPDASEQLAVGQDFARIMC